jgi:hypothetical protein
MEVLCEGGGIQCKKARWKKTSNPTGIELGRDRKPPGYRNSPHLCAERVHVAPIYAPHERRRLGERGVAAVARLEQDGVRQPDKVPRAGFFWLVMWGGVVDE